MTEIRCKKCNRLLMKAKVINAEVKCPKCGYVQNIKKELHTAFLANPTQENFAEDVDKTIFDALNN